MITLTIALILLGGHWFSDFVLQTDAQAKGKSTSNKYLAAHVSTYSLSMFLILFLYNFMLWFCGFSYRGLLPIAEFIGITFAAHFITDYVTSRINSRLWKQQRVHDFFVSVGFDQLLHFTQLLVAYQLIFG